MANEIQKIIEYLQIGRRARENQNFQFVVVVDENYNSENEIIYAEEIQNLTDPSLFKPLESIIAESGGKVYMSYENNSIVYYIQKTTVTPQGDTIVEYKNILEDLWGIKNDSQFIEIVLQSPTSSHYYSYDDKRIIVKTLDEIAVFSDFLYHKYHELQDVTDGEYPFDYKNQDGNTNGILDQLIGNALDGIIISLLNQHKRMIDVEKNNQEGNFYLYPRLHYRSARYILEYPYRKSSERLYSNESYNTFLVLEFNYIGSCLEFLNQTIFNEDLFSLENLSDSKKLFIEDYKKLINTEMNKAIGSITMTLALELLYYIPKDFIKVIDGNSLWSILEKTLEGALTNYGINKEDITLKLLEVLSEKEITKTIFLSKLLEAKKDKESYFAKLYNNMNGENFVKFVKFIHSLWKKTRFTSPDVKQNPEYTQTTGPLFLPYESEKWLGFYFSNAKTSFEKENLKIAFKTGKYKNQERIGAKGEVFDEKVEIIEDYTYHPFYPIFINDIEKQETEIEFERIVPSFFLKANEDKEFWHNVIKTGEYTLDVLTTFSGIGNLAKFRYLVKLGEVGSVIAKIKLVAATVEITSGVTNIMLKLAGLEDTEAGKSLQQYLFWLELLSLSGEITVAIKNGLQKSAKEVLEHSDDLNKQLDNFVDEGKFTRSEADEVIEHLEEVAEISEKTRNTGKFNIVNEGEITLSKFTKIANRIKEEYGINMFFIDRNNEKWQNLFKSWQKKPLEGFFTATSHPSKNYLGIMLDGPSLYLFKGSSVNGYYKITSYTIQHELFHMKMFNRIKEIYPNNYVEIFYKIPDELHESFVLSEFVKARQYTKTWDEADILSDLTSFNRNFEQSKKLDDFSKFDLDKILRTYK